MKNILFWSIYDRGTKGTKKLRGMGVPFAQVGFTI